MQEIEQFRVIELQTQPNETVVFSQGKKQYSVRAFEDGEKWLVRFSPQTTGEWSYSVAGKYETFSCIPAKAGNHGIVRTEGYHFRYDDGTPYIPFGTTIYAWIHQSQELIDETVKSLQNAPFNKVRMCVFPKSMAYNNNEPQDFPFEKENGSWNVRKPIPSFWRRLDWAIQTLDGLGVEVDLILFHPYDHWGFAEISQEDNLYYLDYCIRRLSAYKNVWWSLANEYELCLKKDLSDWDAYGEKLKAEDIYGHLISIHDFCALYPKRDWMSHVSAQSGNTQYALLWRSKYHLPVIVDECGYEGNLEFHWGNLSGFELINRMWKAIVNGGYVTHGETFLHENEVVWWAKGGKLQGESIARIRFLQEFIRALPEYPEPVIQLDKIDPNAAVAGQGTMFAKALEMVSEAEREQITVDMIPLFCGSENYRLFYYARGCVGAADVYAPSEGIFRVEVIDVWEMTRKVISEEMQGMYRVVLPAKEGIAVLLTKIK